MSSFSEKTIPLGAPPSDLRQRRLDLNQLLAPQESSTFYLRMRGDALIDQRVMDGDILVIDCSLAPKPGSLVVFIHNQEMLVRNYDKLNGQLVLYPSNHKYSPIKINSEELFNYWGTVTYTIHNHYKH